MNQPKTKPIHRRGAVLTRPATKKNTQKEGITLISLVVTIIILLILAGVTLALISGSDGILGRATNALDENKIAMAKEQVELALSDFQAQFFDEKYVERTNNGTKKDYISEKLQAGVETTNFYAKASAEGSVVVYEGKDNSGTEVVKGSIQEDASIKWDSNENSGNLGGNNNSEGGSTESSGNNSSGGTISSEELANINTKFAQMQEEITSLKTQVATTNSTLEITQEALNSILTSQTRKDILYEGSASEEGTSYNFTFPAGKTLNDYKKLIFYVDAYYKYTNAWITKQTVMAEAKIRDELYDYAVTYIQGEQVGNRWSLYFSIPNSNQFRIDATRLGEDFNETRIYKVIGIY